MVPLLALLLGASIARAAPGATASSATVKLVEYFLKTPTGDLPPEQVPDFIAVDGASLPPKLQTPFESKRFELLALKKNSDAKYKPPLRMLGKDPPGDDQCGPPRDMSTAKVLLQVGFSEVTEDELEYLMHETKCTECELRTEFTLTIVTTPPRKKGGKKQLHYFFHGNDPIMTLLASYRSGETKSKNTNFFGISMGPKCR